MIELINEINAEAKRYLDAERTEATHTISRAAILNADGVDIEIEQSKLISQEEMRLVRASGALALATTEWFNDVEWMQDPGQDQRSWRSLRLDATYPLEYFEERPTAGSFRGERWLDQYECIDGFGNRDQINFWLLRFVTPGDRTVTELRYPDDPTALDAYNARYRQYLDTLNGADSTIDYHRGWMRAFSRDREKTPLILGGYSLSGLGANELVRQGSPAAEEDQVNTISVNLRYQPEQNGYVGRRITISGNEAVTESYWDGEDDAEQASEELLTTTLELVRNAAGQ